ncbi:hypothetical protein CCO0922 [Campylobacter coli RM2228]|nr:hypothetical protein CCO0922 [Campylobacter coli RM2228]
MILNTKHFFIVYKLHACLLIMYDLKNLDLDKKYFTHFI